MKAESSLYLPVKRFLEKLGFEVKGEICGCDIVALRDGAPIRVVVGELKLSFNLELVLQAVDRIAASDEVWLAVPASRRGRGRERDSRVRKLCRMLGLGLLCVNPTGLVEVLAEPDAFRPRRDPKRRSRLVREHQRRRGDPATGGSTRLPIMTAYRQQALTCVATLATGPARPKDLKLVAPDAPKILQNDVYGWFVRIERGIYDLSDGGRKALVRWAEHLPMGTAPNPTPSQTPMPTPKPALANLAVELCTDAAIAEQLAPVARAAPARPAKKARRRKPELV